MSGVFISYSRQDRGTAERLARVLEAYGWRVWWDYHLAPGESFRAAIRHALDEADAVVVLWSRHSVVSNFVLDEASVALRRGALLPAVIDEGVDLPLGFGDVHTADLTGWPGDAGHPGVVALVAAIARRVGGAAPTGSTGAASS